MKTKKKRCIPSRSRAESVIEIAKATNFDLGQHKTIVTERKLALKARNLELIANYTNK
jgi:hypothetical protein